MMVMMLCLETGDLRAPRLKGAAGMRPAMRLLSPLVSPLDNGTQDAGVVCLPKGHSVSEACAVPGGLYCQLLHSCFVNLHDVAQFARYTEAVVQLSDPRNHGRNVAAATDGSFKVCTTSAHCSSMASPRSSRIQGRST